MAIADPMRLVVGDELADEDLAAAEFAEDALLPTGTVRATRRLRARVRAGATRSAERLPRARSATGGNRCW
jgi:hypothetical protein